MHRLVSLFSAVLFAGFVFAMTAVQRAERDRGEQLCRAR
jgi:hypothetical protein